MVDSIQIEAGHMPRQRRCPRNGGRPAAPLPAHALAATQVVCHNHPTMNARTVLWSQWSCDLQRLIDMAQRGMTALGQAIVVQPMTPIAAGNHETGSYIMGHPVLLTVVICVITMYHMVVNHDIMLNITSLHVLFQHSSLLLFRS
jgi:hypothetical protein